MFFNSRYYLIETKCNLKKHITENNFQNVADLVNFMFSPDLYGRQRYNVYCNDPRVKNKKISILQTFNTIWFFVLYWIVIAPFNYIMYNRIGISQKSKLGQLVCNLIGEQYSDYNINFNKLYKTGWTAELTKEEFLEILNAYNIKTSEEFIKLYGEQVLFNKENIIIENAEDVLNFENQTIWDGRTPFDRFLALTTLIIMLILLPFVGSYRWLKYRTFDYDQNGALMKFYRKVTR